MDVVNPVNLDSMSRQRVPRPPGARRLAVAAAILQILVRVTLRPLGLSRSVALTGWLGDRLYWPAIDRALVTWAVAATGRRLRTSCLVQALAGRVCAGWAGAQVALIIGARRDGLPQFHAWLEWLAEPPSTGLPDEGFTPLVRF